MKDMNSNGSSIPSIRESLHKFVEISQKFIEKSDPEVKKSIETYAMWIKNIRVIIFNVIMLMLLVLIIIVVCAELKRDSIYIEPFIVSEEFESMGYSGEVIANKIIDEFNSIVHSTNIKVEMVQIKPTWSDPKVNLEFIGSEMSLDSISHYLKRVLKIEPICISGELISEPTNKNPASEKKINITIRLCGKIRDTISLGPDIPKEVLSMAAKYLCKQLNPHILAYYLYFDKRKQNETIETIQYVLSNDRSDDDCWAYNLWGLILKNKGQYKKAENLFIKAIRSNKKFPYAYNSLGSVLWKQKKFRGAINMFQIATEMDPKFSWAYNNWGNALAEENKYSLANEKYKKALEIDPKSSYTYANWGTILYEQGMYKEAIDKYKHAIEIDPKINWVYFNWGLALYELKEYNNAIEMFKKAIEIYENDKDKQLVKDPVYQYYFHWGLSLYEMEEYIKAIEMFKKAIKIIESEGLESDKIDLYYYNLHWALTLHKLGQYENAIEKYKKAELIMSDLPSLFLSWGDTLKVQKKYKNAIKKYKKAIELGNENPDSKAFYGIYEILIAMNNKVHASEIFVIALCLDIRKVIDPFLNSIKVLIIAFN